ncbi:PAS domain-containing protein [Natrinema salaciae]|uniref:histidine kinase n=1 Tax=Natrinema salaciae TaxID=1186196 RepID=A0A1H9RN43_9EURY|nr:PAS domain-containing protein [Natrinema salaciae]SER73493.1 PAS domain S-box-containing protein [Natrinema salaciae]
MAAADSSSDSLRSRVRYQEAVADLGQLALESSDLDRLLTDAAATVRDVLEADACSVFELRPDGDAAVLRADAGWRDDAVGSVTVPTDADSWVDAVLESADPIVTDLGRADRAPDSADRGSLADGGGAGGIAAAIDAPTEPWGTLDVRGTDREVTDRELDFVASVADLLAAAVENHRAGQRGPAAGAVTDGIVEPSFDRVADGFLGLDAEWTVTYVNERARALLDPDDEGLVGEPLWEAFPAAVGSTFETECRRAMVTQEPTSFDASVPPLEAWYDVHASPSETGLSVIFRDGTNRTGTERELAATNRTLQRLYAITADSERTFDEKIDDLLALGRDRLRLEGGFLARIDEDADRFEVTHASGPNDELRPGTVASLSTAYCKRTVATDDLLAFTDSPLAHGIDEDAYAEWELDAYLGGRVTVDGEPYGTLCFEDASPRSEPFTPAERSFVELAAQWISYELERQARQRDLEESERRYRTLVEHFPNGIVALFDADMAYTLAGGEILAEIDLSVSEFVGQTVRERYDGETRETFETNFDAALAGEHRSFEFSMHDREWNAHAVPVEDDRGDVFAGMLMVQDVTEAKRKQRQLREREARLERFKQYTDDVLDTVDDVFYVLDDTGDLNRWNETLADVTGYTDAEMESMHALEFFEGADANRIATAVAEAFETGSTRVEATVQTKDGTGIPYEFVASTLENPAGDPVVTGIGRDVTDQREYQRQLEGLVDDLEESNRRLEQFAYAASHDLQEPLRMVSSYLTLVERRYADALDEDGAEFIEFAVDGADRMQEMIDGLLDYSRVDTQGDPFRAVDCEAVLDDVLADLEVRIDETDAEIDVGPLPRVHADPGQLRQLFQNLVDNAITYSGDGTPRISVFAENDGPTWTVSVRDRGIGIEPDDADRIFRVFDRLHSHEEYAGTGIGLALCRRIVERHDGEIAVDSEPGEGSTFTVTLPAVSDAETEPATSHETDAATDAAAETPTDE